MKFVVPHKAQTIAGILVTAVGIIGIFVSFTVQKSDVDPVAMMIAFASIAISIVGISLLFETPSPSKALKENRP
jgi:hypothetical protein